MMNVTRKIGCWLVLLLALNVPVFGQVQYATLRLEAMANLLSLKLEKLEVGDNEGYSYKGHPLVIRTNRWKEVEHIGYRLFSAEIRHGMPYPVYDFLERYFLELDLLTDIDKLMRLALDKVQISNTNLNVIHTFDGSEQLKVDMLPLKKYQVTWSRSGTDILTVVFDMDYQLLSGCNAIESERNLLRDLQRYQEKDGAEQALQPHHFDTEGVYWQMDDGTYILNEIRHTLYYAKNDAGEWKLICDVAHPVWSAFNLMLSQGTDHDCNLEMVVDLYGYQEKEIDIPLKKWIRFCADQGCKSYMGIKTHGDKMITGTLFIVNEKMGYNHMLTIELDKEVIARRGGAIRSRLYAYIPLHNVSDDYFKFYTKVPAVDTLK